jgi:hypothetical protein
MAVLEKLPIGAAAGASGWTYAVMKAIFLQNVDYSDHASLLLAVFIPKKNEPPPLGIGNYWDRFFGRVALSKVGESSWFRSFSRDRWTDGPASL